MKAMWKWPALFLAVMVLAGCATSGGSVQGGQAVALELRQIDGSVLGGEVFNAIRVETYGPYQQQMYGYFLYRDGTTVTVTGRITGKPIGRMTPADVQADYQRTLQATMSYGGNLIFREALAGGKAAGYTANMPMLNYTVWNMGAGTAGATVLQLTYP